MKPSVNNLNSNQPKMLSKREDKKRVNIAWNHGLYFQIGLILSLLAVFFVMEMSLGYKIAKTDNYKGSVIEEPPMFVFEIYKEPTPEIPKKKVVKKQLVKAKPIIDVVKEVSNKAVVRETKTATTDTPIIDAPVIDKPTTPVINSGPSNIKTVEFVPVFPGCELLSNNEERRACMSSKINAFVQRKFKTDKFDDFSNSGKQKIYVQFKIDPSGNIVDVVARGPHNTLEDEATRVIGMLPKMQPGRQGKTNVAVMYSLPIVFQVN